MTLSTSLKAGDWDVLIASPPCNTFSRARGNSDGPAPLRSSDRQYGFPWLEGNAASRIREANQLVDRTVAAIICGRESSSKTQFLLEHPEHLGRSKSGYNPASIWKWPSVEALLAKGVWQGALFQCSFGANYAAPTRIMTSLSATAKLKAAAGPINLTETDEYAGPLASWCGHRHPPLMGKTAQGTFKTAMKAAYPPQLCAAI